MNWTIPGTILQGPRTDAVHISQQFGSMFLGGGVVLSQVAAVTGLEGHSIQNWVKRGFLRPPVQKRYDIDQLCRIATINALNGVLTMDRICGLLGYVNGQLDDDSDNLIRDSELYFLFVRLAARAKELYKSEDRDILLDQALQDYQAPSPDARRRVKNVLRIMLTVWLAARMRQESENMITIIEKENAL